jgi:hypothetical protein
MQTLDPTNGLDEPVADSPRRRRPWAWVALGAAIVLAVAGVAYAAGSNGTTAKTVVRTVNVSPSNPKPRNCIPGAAPGSCNTDEFVESQIKDQPLDATTRAALAAQLVAARTAALKYPTVADATRAGMIVAGQFSPLTGAHYLSFGGVLGPFDPSKPGAYIYDGTSPTSRIVGLMYLGGGINPPEGFAGPNDHWHRHSNTCVVFSGGKIVIPFPADSSVTKAQCDAQNGTFMRRTTWMVHAWVIPGWESPLGVFSHENPDLLCADGTTKTDANGFCKGT